MKYTHAPLLSYIKERSTTALSEQDIDLIQEAFLPLKLKKKQFFLREGEICQYIAFIVKGAMRQFMMDEKGTEHTLQLGLENWWTSDRESFQRQVPSIYNIHAWEDTDLLLLPKANGYYDKVNAIVAFNEMRIRLDDNNHIANQRRMNVTKSFPAKYRYQEFANTYPEFLQRFPQHVIASYLGITKETLSRIQRK